MSTFFGLILALCLSLFVPLVLGVSVTALFQGVSLSVVVFGTLASLLISFPLAKIQSAFRIARQVWTGESSSPASLVKFLLESSQIARREGLLALESQIPKAPDVVLQKLFRSMIDGASAAAILEFLEVDLRARKSAAEGSLRVIESAAQISPAMGMIGAILGILPLFSGVKEGADAIQNAALMAAFVSAFYGIAFAQWIFQPTLEKVRVRLDQDQARLSLLKTGVLGIQEGQSPVVMEERLGVYLNGS